MLYAVPKTDSEFEIVAYWIFRVRPAMFHARFQFPSPALAVNLDVPPRVLLLPVVIVNSISQELCLKHVEPGDMHVHEEGLKWSTTGWPVVELDGIQSLLT
jgi:hypothetical protein